MEVNEMARPPLSVRQDPERLEAFQAVREGVPEGARRVLVEWCDAAFRADTDPPYAVKIRLFEMSRDEPVPDYVASASGYWAEFLWTDDDLLLDAIDFVLQWSDKEPRARLAFLLRESRSNYRVAQGDDGQWELQKTYSDEMIALVEATAGQTGRAAEHLRIAWSKIAGRHPDPDKACWDAAKAVEVAAKPFVSPNDSGLTLGRMIGEMGKHPERWECELTPVGSVERVVDMMRVVWEEGRRHGDETKPIGVSPEAAEIVVQTAVVLTHWFESGFVRRVST